MIKKKKQFIKFKGGDETSDSGLLLQFIIQNTESIKQQLKLVKRRLPQDASITKCNLSSKTLHNLRKSVELLNKVMSLIYLTAKHVIAYVTSDAADATTMVSISHDKLWELLNQLSERVYEQDDRGASQNIKNVLTNANTDMSQLAQYLLDHEYEIMSVQQNEKVHPPIVLRAQIVKKHLEETKTLTATLENKEAEIRQLKMNAKLKQSELSEMQIRKDLAEKKLSVLQQDHESNSMKLQKQYEEVLEKLEKYDQRDVYSFKKLYLFFFLSLYRKEKEFEETMDHLQSDIDSLENERGALREKLKVHVTKKGDLKTTTALDITAGSPFIAQELMLLKKALHDERKERMNLQAEQYHKILRGLKPLHVPKIKDQRINVLEDELRKVKYVSTISFAYQVVTHFLHHSRIWLCRWLRALKYLRQTQCTETFLNSSRIIRIGRKRSKMK